MNNNYRYILAGVLIFLIIIFQPVYLKWLGYDEGSVVMEKVSDASDLSKNIITSEPIETNAKFQQSIYADRVPESFITIVAHLFIATISNRSGGTLNSYTLTKVSAENYKYEGGYDEIGMYDKHIPVSLLLPSENYCQPCLATYDDIEDRYNYINSNFRLITYSGLSDTIFLSPGESTELKYELNDDFGNILVQKSLSFFADSFVSLHEFSVNEEHFNYVNSLELLWSGGLRPTEESEDEDVQYGSGIISQAGEFENIQINDILYDGKVVYANSILGHVVMKF